MKLDLLYEFQPKIKPWSKPHPYGQREAEQRTYDEAIAEIQYADKLGFNTVWVVEHHFRDGRSASPCSEAILGGLALSTEQIKLGFGVTLMPFGFIHPARVAEKVATVDVLSATAGSSGGPVARRRWSRSRSACRPTTVRVTHWKEAIEIVVGDVGERDGSRGRARTCRSPSGCRRPKPYQDPHPPVWQAAATEKSAVSAGRARPRPAVVRAAAAGREDGRRTSARTAPRRRWPAPRTCSTRVQQRPGRRLHARALLRRRRRGGRRTASGSRSTGGTSTSPSSRCSGSCPMLSRGGAEGGLPAAPAGDRRAQVPVEHYQDEDMIIIGTPDECLEKILRYETRRRRRAALLRAVRRPAAREGDAQPRAAGHGGHAQARGARPPRRRDGGASDGHDLGPARRRGRGAAPRAALRPRRPRSRSTGAPRSSPAPRWASGARPRSRTRRPAPTSCSPTATPDGLAETRRAGRRASAPRRSSSRPTSPSRPRSTTSPARPCARPGASTCGPTSPASSATRSVVDTTEADLDAVVGGQPQGRLLGLRRRRSRDDGGRARLDRQRRVGGRRDARAHALRLRR